jgi:hypothetical protein
MDKDEEIQDGRGQGDRDSTIVPGFATEFRVLEEHEEIVEGLRQTLRSLDQVLLTGISLSFDPASLPEPVHRHTFDGWEYLKTLASQGDRSTIYDPSVPGAHVHRAVGEGPKGSD